MMLDIWKMEATSSRDHTTKLDTTISVGLDNSTHQGKKEPQVIMDGRAGHSSVKRVKSTEEGRIRAGQDAAQVRISEGASSSIAVVSKGPHGTKIRQAWVEEEADTGDNLPRRDAPGIRSKSASDTRAEASSVMMGEGSGPFRREDIRIDINGGTGEQPEWGEGTRGKRPKKKGVNRWVQSKREQVFVFSLLQASNLAVLASGPCHFTGCLSCSVLYIYRR